VLAGETYYCQRSAQLYVEAMRSEAMSVARNLTARERQVLRAFARGENPKVSADRIGISSKTLNNVMAGIKEKLGIHEPGALVRYAIKHGYVEEP
jgi:DNA-binding NarL/FixJ family response regulator